MLKYGEVEKICQLLQGSREKAVQHGDYETAIEEHDQVIRQCTKLQKTCDINTSRKFEIIKEKCRLELKIFQEILFKLKEIQKPVQTNGNKSSIEIDPIDPDVWAPPTPIHNRRGQDENLPIWARNAAPQNNARVEPSRRQSSGDDGGKVRRKDPIPENRRR